MPNIPNLGVATYDGQCCRDNTDDLIDTMASGKTGVINGCAVTAGGSMTINVAAGNVMAAGVVYAYAGGSVSVPAASTTDRRDVIALNAGVLYERPGTACGTSGWTRASPASSLPPVKPALAAGDIVLAEIYVPGTITTITTAMITDKRVTLVQAGTTPYVLASVAKAMSAGVALTPVGSDYAVSASSGTWNTGTNGFQVPNAGLFLVVASLQSSVVCWVSVTPTHNGSAISPQTSSYTAGVATMSTSALVVAAAGDYIGLTGTVGAAANGSYNLQIVQVLATSGPVGATGPTGPVLTPVGESSNFNAVAGNIYEITATCTATLPSAAAAGATIGFFVAAGNLTITGVPTSAYINGPGQGGTNVLPTLKLWAVGARVTLESDGFNWMIVSGESDSGWVSPTISTATTYNYAVQLRKIGNVVRFQGGITTGTADVTFITSGNIPAGMVPNRQIYPGAGMWVSGGYLNLSSGGFIQHINGSAMLDGVTYTVD